MSVRTPQYIHCDKKECWSFEHGKCLALAEEIEGGCSFFKKKTTQVLELGALSAVPVPDWELYRRHSETTCPTKDQLINWLIRAEAVAPTDNEELIEKLRALGVVPKDDGQAGYVLASKLKLWLDMHPGGKGWCMNADETIKAINEMEVDNDEIDESDDGLSE